MIYKIKDHLITQYFNNYITSIPRLMSYYYNSVLIDKVLVYPYHKD